MPPEDPGKIQRIIETGKVACFRNAHICDAGEAVVALANEKGVPVITVDRGINGGEVVCHIASDNVMSAAANITVVSSQVGDWDRAKGMTIMENVLASNPEVKAVFSANDVMAMGAVDVVLAYLGGEAVEASIGVEVTLVK